MRKTKTCEGCGLSNANMETKPANPFKTPCQFCTRNPNAQAHIADFHDSAWILDANNEAIIDIEPDPHQQNLLKILNHVINIYHVKPQEVKA